MSMKGRDMCPGEAHHVVPYDESTLGILRGRTRPRALLPLLGGDAASMLTDPARFIERSREVVEQLTEPGEMQRVVPDWDARLRQDAAARGVAHPAPRENRRDRLPPPDRSFSSRRRTARSG